jgi:hypothetical protein
MVEALYRYTSLDELTSRDERYVGGDIDGLCINAGFMLRW